VVLPFIGITQAEHVYALYALYPVGHGLSELLNSSLYSRLSNFLLQVPGPGAYKPGEPQEPVPKLEYP
jgi:hypothetical protein